MVDAVAELAGEGPGDVLVFLSGEREIHDIADALRRSNCAGLEVLPLYARLSSAEQHRIFERPIVGGGSCCRRTSPRRRSRCPVCATWSTPDRRASRGTAGGSRSSGCRSSRCRRHPPISVPGDVDASLPASASGSTTQDDFESRPEFTEPEILRTNLASVILQMTAIGLGDVDRFPFVEPPDQAAIRDGYLLLDELAALTEGAIGTATPDEVGAGWPGCRSTRGWAGWCWRPTAKGGSARCW